MIALALSLVLAQTAPTSAEILGARNTIADALVGVKTKTRTYTANAGHSRICIPPPTGRPVPVNAVTLRIGVFAVTPTLLTELGVPAAPRDEYVAVEVRAAPASSVTSDLRSTNVLFDLLRNETSKIASPTDATCEVLIVRSNDPSAATWFRCACYKGSGPCNWDADASGPDAAGPAPRNLTMNPGTWSGNGCKPKPCAARYSGRGIDASWPTECPK